MKHSLSSLRGAFRPFSPLVTALKLNNHSRQLGPRVGTNSSASPAAKKGGRSLRVETPAWLCEGEERLLTKFFQYAENNCNENGTATKENLL
jgi:hypothetical protein